MYFSMVICFMTEMTTCDFCDLPAGLKTEIREEHYPLPHEENFVDFKVRFNTTICSCVSCQNTAIMKMNKIVQSVSDDENKLTILTTKM